MNVIEESPCKSFLLGILVEMGRGTGKDQALPPGAAEDQRLDIGQRVKTTAPCTPDGDWTEEALKSRRWGVSGVITAEHDSHGLCYDVLHDVDGTVGHYDPRELEVQMDAHDVERAASLRLANLEYLVKQSRTLAEKVLDGETPRQEARGKRSSQSDHGA